MGYFYKTFCGFFKVTGEEIGFCNVEKYTVADTFADVCAVEFVQENYGFFIFFLNKGVFKNFEKEEVVA